MIFFLGFTAFLILQRSVELIAAKKNERIIRCMGAVEYDVKGYRFIVMMHTFFFISLLIEFLTFSKVINQFWYIFFSIFLFAQVIRYWALISLGIFWNTKILVIPGTELINKGPYKYLRHPNYLAVIIELAVIPLIFSCYFTSILFSIMNIVVLVRRIKIEEKALKGS
jgi:methyltransferase